MTIAGLANTVCGLTLGAVGALHIAWGRGASWPLKTREELAERVVGGPEGPPPAACYAVGGALVGAGALMLLGRRSRLAQLTRYGAAAALGARAVATVAGMENITGPQDLPERFMAADQKVYRPLCAVLAASALLATRLRTPASED